jgi:hypothetical protein
MGLIHNSLTQPRQAISRLLQAMNLNPNDLQSAFELGKAYTTLGDTKKAVE